MSIRERDAGIGHQRGGCWDWTSERGMLGLGIREGDAGIGHQREGSLYMAIEGRVLGKEKDLGVSSGIQGIPVRAISSSLEYRLLVIACPACFWSPLSEV